MKRLATIVVLGILGLYAAGCGSDVSDQDQLNKMAALKSAEKASQEKDGIKSE